MTLVKRVIDVASTDLHRSCMVIDFLAQILGCEILLELASLDFRPNGEKSRPQHLFEDFLCKAPVFFLLEPAL